MTGAGSDGRIEEDGPARPKNRPKNRPEAAPGRDVKQRPEPAPERDAKPGSRRKWLALGALIAIVAVAALLRFWDLAINPAGIYGDEAAEGLDAARLLHQPGFHADFGVWFTSDGGREALFAYVVAAVYNFTGVTILALRATAAAFGVAGVIGIWALGRRFGEWVGLTAAAWAAGSLWLICISRDGMRNTIVPFFGAVALIALLRWAARPGRGAALIAGAVTSVAALYTYQPLKLLPVLAVVWLLWLRRVDRERYDRLRAGVVPFAIAFLVVAAPMIAVAITDPTNYFGRAAEVSALNPDVTSRDWIPTHILKTIGMFGFFGDGNGRHNVSMLPLLPLPLVGLAALGLRRLWLDRRDAAKSLILLSLPIFMLPPLIATEGWSPHFLRVLGLAAPLGVTIGLGAAEFVELARRHRWRAAGGRGAGGGAGGRRAGGRAAGGAAIAAVALTLALVAAWSGYVYLNRSAADQYEPYRLDIVAAGQYAHDHPTSAVVMDSFSETNLQLIYWPNPPALFVPGDRISNPAQYRTIVGLNQADLASCLGPELAARAVPIAWDPAGQPSVWAVTP
jgi:4-amino-4-deoxy-L-arabinose transferase-like glycosyltransferase